MKKTLMSALLLSAVVFSAMPSGDTITNSRGLKFKRIPAGTFEMGFEGRALTGSLVYDGVDSGFYNEHPRHAVRLTRDFYMGVLEVTNAQFKLFRPNHGTDIPWYGSGADLPVHNLTWYGADSFCQWLTANDPDGYAYRLPTEAEWEYCCRAGTNTWFSTGDTIDTSLANLTTTLRNAGADAPNPWGLYDMHGNAREWCLDWFGLYGADTAVNPGGLVSGEQKTVRSLIYGYSMFRSAARGSHFPEVLTDFTLGFRVVISELTQDSLRYAPVPEDFSPWKRNIALSRPAPATPVSGENHTDGDGLSFKRVRMTRSAYPAQKDSVVYVSLSPVSGDSAVSRLLAGAYAKRLSGTYGVLYRISNRYELAEAGITPSAGAYFLTILPDLKYAADAPHPDAAYYLHRRNGAIAPDGGIGGPLYWRVNHNAYIGEWPNGDIVATWYSGKTEDNFEQNIGCSRLRLGEAAWDDSASLCRDLAGMADYSTAFWDDGRGRLFEYWSNLRTGTYARFSTDMGNTWSPLRLMVNSRQGTKHLDRLNGDSVITVYDQSGGGGTVLLSTDGGYTWTVTGIALRGIHESHALLDDGTLRVFKRSAPVTNDSGASVMGSFRTPDLGRSWDTVRTPFYPPNIGQYDVVLKLHSGRLLMATYCPASGKGGVVLVESEDQGRTWFCRRKFGANGGNGDVMLGYKDMCQGRDGIIHLQGTMGSGTGNGGRLPQASFSEQWLREGSCLDVSEWGIPTAGMVAADCPDEDSMPPLDIGAAASVGAATRAAPTLVATPNPFNPSTTIIANLPVNQGAELSLYSIAGRAIRHWNLKAGIHRIAWNGRDAAGKAVPSGCYFLVMKTSGNNQLNERLVLLK